MRVRSRPAHSGHRCSSSAEVRAVRRRLSFEERHLLGLRELCRLVLDAGAHVVAKARRGVARDVPGPHRPPEGANRTAALEPACRVDQADVFGELRQLLAFALVITAATAR